MAPAWETIRLAIGALAVAMPLGIVLAEALHNAPNRLRTLGAAALAGLATIPLYLLAASWEAGFGRRGWATHLLETADLPPLSGWIGAVAVHGLAGIPIVVLLALIGRARGPTPSESAMALDAGPVQVWWRVTARRLAPRWTLASLSIVTAALAEMVVADLYAVPTLARQFYAAAARATDVSTALVAAVPLTLGTVIALGLVLGRGQTTPRAEILDDEQPTLPNPTGVWWRAAIVMVVLVPLVAVPIGNLVGQLGWEVRIDPNGTRERYYSLAKAIRLVTEVPLHFASEAGWTLAIALPATLVSLAIGGGLGLVTQTRPIARGIAMSVLVGMASVPGPLTALALLAFSSHADGVIAELVDRSVFLPVVAAATRLSVGPFLLMVLLLRHLPGEALDALRLDGMSRIAATFRMAVWRRRWLWVATGLVLFTATAGELSATILVTPPGIDPLPRRLFGLMHAGADDTVASVTIFVLAVQVGIVAIAIAAGSRGRDSSLGS